MDVLLNGKWSCGVEGQGDRQVTVPGLAADPTQPTAGALRYRREVELPRGGWTHATLLLKGARFAPAVSVNGEQVSRQPGGMAPTCHPLDHKAVKPGQTIQIEIALQPLTALDGADASRIPPADLWRSNVSSGLWDDVVLHLHGPTRLARVVVGYQPDNDKLSVRWWLDERGPTPSPLHLKLYVEDQQGTELTRDQFVNIRPNGRRTMPLKGVCERWSPEEPNLYRLRVELAHGRHTVDAITMPLGLREFVADGIGFKLNDQPVTLRAGTVVWHRWCRDPEASGLAFDEAWFERNIVRRLKELGANTLRFHLGPPPERLLDLCDRHGLLVQTEWLFFHGIAASRESMEQQWRAWLDASLRHPCVALIHPWNETEDRDQTQRALDAMAAIEGEYPPMVVSHRDVIHVHRYWWSLFENVGVLFDTAAQFDRPIMVDEFGGNYLDGEANPGQYPTVREALLRFLGPQHDAASRMELHTLANARMAEYWRRIGAAGFSPFCALGSPADGNHHFLGPLAEGRPKPVWAALAAAYAPVSVSLDVWDRNYTPGQRARLPVHLFNETAEARTVGAEVRAVTVTSSEGAAEAVVAEREVRAFGHEVAEVELTMPRDEGVAVIEARRRTPADGGAVVSSWPVRTMVVRTPARLVSQRMAVGVPEDDTELRAMLASHVNMVGPGDPAARLIVAGRASSRKLAAGAEGDGLRAEMTAAIERGVSVVLLDVGPMFLGTEYDDGMRPVQVVNGTLQQPGKPKDPKVESMELVMGVRAVFRQAVEPESCVHATGAGRSLWWNMEARSTQLWNGLRGGLIVPAMEMEATGLGREAVLAMWVERGADREAATSGACVAYELAGMYAFAAKEDPAVVASLRERVKFLMDDAPALEHSLNPAGAVRMVDVAAMVREAGEGRGQRFTPLAVAGKNLWKTPVVEIGFGAGRGGLIVSQLITSGRLAEGFGGGLNHPPRVDPAAQQMVLNLLERGVSDAQAEPSRAVDG